MPAIGPLLGAYQVERQLGRGAMAVVHLALDLRHDRLVAVKVLRPEVAAAIGAARFLREIQIAAQLQHASILPLFDSGQVEHTLFYVMPFIAGGTLRDRLRREGAVPVGDAIAIAATVADALAAAHREGVVHRDIKPENILLDEGRPLVADFGVARLTGEAGHGMVSTSGLAVGTPGYMSPEQIAGDRELDGRSDVYSLGCVLYEMLVGEPPFTGPSAQAVANRHMYERVPSVRVVRPEVPAWLEQAVMKALAKVPGARYAGAADFGRALRAGGVTPPAAPPAR
jgi:serine/threonine-protein kinase